MTGHLREVPAGPRTPFYDKLLDAGLVERGERRAVFRSVGGVLCLVIEARDLDAALADARAAGGVITAAPAVTPIGYGARVRDPDQNQIWIVRWPSPRR